MIPCMIFIHSLCLISGSNELNIIKITGIQQTCRNKHSVIPTRVSRRIVKISIIITKPVARPMLKQLDKYTTHRLLVIPVFYIALDNRAACQLIRLGNILPLQNRKWISISHTTVIRMSYIYPVFTIGIPCNK